MSSKEDENTTEGVEMFRRDEGNTTRSHLDASSIYDVHVEGTTATAAAARTAIRILRRHEDLRK